MGTMNRILVQSVCLLTLSAVAFSNAYAGAWTQKKHGYYLKLSVNYLHTTKEFNHEGDKLNIFQERIVYQNASFRDFNVTAYAEYGFTDKFTAIASVPFKILRSKRTELVGGGLLARIATIYTLGVSDLTLLGRYKLLDRGMVLSLQGGVKLPLLYDESPADDGAPLGTGHVDLEGQLLVGKSLYPLPVYLTTGVGYRKRTGDIHDQVFSSAEAGYTFGKLLIKVTWDGLWSTVTPPDIVGAPVTTPLPGGGGALPNVIVGDQNIFKISPAIILNLSKRLSVQGDVLHIYGGKDTVAGTIFSFGVILQK